MKYYGRYPRRSGRHCQNCVVFINYIPEANKDIFTYFMSKKTIHICVYHAHKQIAFIYFSIFFFSCPIGCTVMSAVFFESEFSCMWTVDRFEPGSATLA